MVSVWALPAINATFEDDGVLRLSNGREFTLASIPGNNWNANRLEKLNKAVQAFVDDVQPVADIPPGDADEGATPAELLARYGNRRFLDGQGNIVSRSVKILIEHRPPDAIDGNPGVLPKQLVVTISTVR